MSTQLSPTPIFKAFNNDGVPLVGGLLYTYAAGTSTPLVTYKDSVATPNTNPVILNARGECALWLDPILSYKFYLTDSLGNQIPGYPVDNIQGMLATQAQIGSILYPQTVSELAANVTPTNYIYPPGDVRRYGALPSSDITAALVSAAAQAQQTGGAALYVPGALGTSSTVTAGISFTSPVTIYGDGYFLSAISTGADVPIFSFDLGASGSIVKDLTLIGKGAGATTAGILYTNSNNNVIRGCKVKSFKYGVYYARGANSCYLNTIEDSLIISAIDTNIYGEYNTNALHIINTTFGGGPATRGLYLVDSEGLNIFGGDVEGMTLCALDLDNSVAGFNSHLIMNLNLDGNTSSAGDIRLGNTAAVRGITILGGYFHAGASNDSAVNAVNCDGLVVIGGTVASGYTNHIFLNKGNLTNEFLFMGRNLAASQYWQNTFKSNYADQQTLTWEAATVFDAAYQDSANYHLYKIASTSIAANKDYFAGLDVLRITSTGAAGAGSKAYARGMIASDSAGGSNRKGAAYMVGDVDIDSGALSLGQSATAPVIVNGNTITTIHVTVARVAPGGAVTGIILAVGTISGQVCTVINESAAGNTVTFAAAGTSNVADGVGSVIAGLNCRTFVWDSSTSLWYPAK